MALYGLIEGSAPLATTRWTGRTGFATAPPVGPGQSSAEWARDTQFDLAALRQYGAAVYAATDLVLDRLGEATLARSLDLSAMGIGARSVAWLLTTGWVTNVKLRCGEISCIKGLLGARGYPAGGARRLSQRPLMRRSRRRSHRSLPIRGCRVGACSAPTSTAWRGSFGRTP